MKLQLSLNRMRMQMMSIERMMRLLQSELETQIGALAPADVNRFADVPSGLSRLLQNGETMAPRLAEAYKPFADAVWVGLDHEKGSASATVALKAASEPAALGTFRSARLSINPVFPLAEKPGWLTLETDIDLDPLRRARGMRLDLVSFFDIASRNEVNIARNVQIGLRRFWEDGNFDDLLNYQMPVSTMPFEHAVTVPDSTFAELQLDRAHRLSLIFVLPTAGDYTFHMDYLSIKSLG
ncbi:hypothetical protein [Falsirhodobacter algicola]|uniref:Uncharacterized protein n=1 Tax=Falsirhodobacter algicola TaxID=2692330 RepID=A0A8J8MT96_9RHOB|nr:hypothetical protein [Falsirhodobacter algicola]QUS36084.1 hypothetical protein GR316_07260 [Falsirhodobacter algicola]